MLSDLESKLEATQSARMRLIVTDGVFSMDGNVAPLKSVLFLILDNITKKIDSW